MGITIDDEEVFKQSLIQGINLFTGAGFSVLPDEEGNKLPLGPEYAVELKQHFQLTLSSEELDDIANILEGDALQEYTRKRFTVTKINRKYYNLNRIHLNAFITTNYDNIPLLINETNSYYKLCDARNGPQMGKNMVKYVPIHGNVISEEYPIIIGSLSVSLQNKYSSVSVSESEKLVSEAPTLIWGNGMKDSSTLQIFNQVRKDKSQNIWIQCLDNDSKIDVYRQLGFKIIVSDTESLLDWIETNIPEYNTTTESRLNDPDLIKYHVPSSKEDVKSAESDEFYNYGVTQWFHILTGLAYERKIVSKIHNEALKTKHVVIVGSDFSGKTTALMQLALKVSSPNKFYFNNITTEMCELIASKIQGYDTWIFLDNCSSLEQIDILSADPNTTLVATTTEYKYESEKNKITTINPPVFNITEITDQQEARKIREKIPKKLRTSEFTYKKEEDEKYSMIELISGNVNSVLSKTMVRKVLDHIKKVSEESFEMIELAVYLSKRWSAISTDVIMAYFAIRTYDQVMCRINRINSLLRELDKNVIQIEPNEMDQDFFIMRSGLFLNKCVELFETSKGIPSYRNSYGNMIRKFVDRVSPIHVWNYEVFKRKQYDSELFFIIFGNEADDVYEELYRYSSNIFVIQQRALYHRRCGKYKEAFEEISRVYSDLPNNPSVKNSYAMILFEMNRQENEPDSLEKMKKAMKMFEELHENDQRKLYHTEKYAEYAIYLAKKKKIYDYLSNAIDWIDSLSLSYNHKLYDQRSIMVSLINKKQA